MDKILFAGQGSKIFAVREIVEKIFGTVPFIDNYQENAVSLGLCYYTGVLEGRNKAGPLLLDTNYTAIKVRCTSPKKPESSPNANDADFFVSHNHNENDAYTYVLGLANTIPTTKIYSVGLAGPGRIVIELWEESTIDGVEDAVVGAIPVEIETDASSVLLVLKVDHNRTIMVAVKNDKRKTIEYYQLNNTLIGTGSGFWYDGNDFGSTEGYTKLPFRPIPGARALSTGT